jgi:hypothetical protein
MRGSESKGGHMTFFDDIKAKADANGDGKLSGDDIAGLKEKYPDQANQISELQTKADGNGDGKLDFEDAKSMAGDIFNTAKDMFGKK